MTKIEVLSGRSRFRYRNETCPVQRGPRDLLQLVEFFGQTDERQRDYGAYDIEIVAEINQSLDRMRAGMAAADSDRGPVAFVTDANGAYSIAGLAPGAYTVAATLVGCCDTQWGADINDAGVAEDFHFRYRCAEDRKAARLGGGD